MPGYFENGVFTDNQPAWHRAGVVREEQYLTTAQVLEHVPELASEVVKAPLYAAYDFGDGTQVIGAKDRYATVRVMDRKVLGTVSSRYKIVQPVATLEFGEAVVDAGGLWKTAGSLCDGALMWGMLELPDEIRIAGLEDERMKPFLSVWNSFDGTTGLGAMLNWTRIVCKNTFDAAVGEAPRSFSIRHSEGVDGRIAEARKALSITFEAGKAIQELGDRLIATKMSKRDAQAFLANLVPFVPDEDEAKRDSKQATRADIAHLFTASPNLQNVTGTRWGMLQAVFEFDQFYAKPKASPESAMRRSLKQSRLGQQAVALLSK